MNKAFYTGTKTANGGEGKFPLSTETLGLIQEQITLLQTLAGIGGVNYIIVAPDGKCPGAAVVFHEATNETPAYSEVLEIDATPKYTTAMKWLTVTEKVENIKADGETYLNARVLRTAHFTRTAGSESYELNKFANINSSGTLEAFPTNAALAAKLANLPNTVLTWLQPTLDEKLISRTQWRVTKEQLDGFKTPCVLSCCQSVALFGSAEYTLVVTAQGSKMVRQEIIQGDDQHYVRTFNGTSWGAWVQQLETAMHIDVKIVRGTVWLRHGALAPDCDIVLLRKKKRSAWRATGGPNSFSKNRGTRKKRQPKTQYVLFKGIKLSKGEPGKWYVPKCVAVADPKRDGGLIGKEMPTLCESLFYVGDEGFYRMQGTRKKIVLKSTKNTKGTQHRAYAPIGIQIARLKPTGGKDSGGEIVPMKYRVSQTRRKLPSGTVNYSWKRSFSLM